jgi:aspartate aminotransferase
MISNRVNNIKPSLTIATNIKAQELKRAGRDIIVLAAGEPDFDTPENIKQAAIKAINEGFTKYVPGKGTPDLQKAIQAKFKNDNGLEYDLGEITVGVGGKHIIYNAFSATMNPGDEVIIPAPYWVSYPDIVILNGGSPIIVQCGEENGFKLSPQDLEKNITSKTKWLMLNSPSNPTGSMYTKEELLALAEVLKKY